MTEHLVIPGATRFHGVNWPVTNALRDPRCLRLARRIAAAHTKHDFEATHSVERQLRNRFETLGLDKWSDLPPYYRLSDAVSLDADLAVPLCWMARIQPPITHAEAVGRGLTWSRECAKKLGLYEDAPDGRHPLARCDATGARRAFMHALDCDVCWHEGIGKCEIFALVARREIESDVDPRLEELLAA